MITVLFSGGQDSTTCLLLAIEESIRSAKQEWATNENRDFHWDVRNHVQAVSIHYGQRHSVEMEQAQKICDKLGVARHVLDVTPIFAGSTSAMLASGDAPPDGAGEGVAPTFLPGRNGLFIQLAAIHAARTNSSSVVIGVNEVDFSGYPDCRQEFIRGMKIALKNGYKEPIELISPLLELSKREIVNLAYQQEALLSHWYHPNIVNECLELSHTCYNGERPACGKCAACIIRKDGFEKAGLDDPAYNEQRTK